MTFILGKCFWFKLNGWSKIRLRNLVGVDEKTRSTSPCISLGFNRKITHAWQCAKEKEREGEKKRGGGADSNFSVRPPILAYEFKLENLYRPLKNNNDLNNMRSRDLNYGPQIGEIFRGVMHIAHKI